MIGRAPTRTNHRLIVAAGSAACAALLMIGCGTTYYEIPIETPIQPKMDVSPFQRVLVAGFVAGGTEDVDANQETVRLLRSQLRTKSQLRVIDADLLPLMDVAASFVARDPPRRAGFRFLIQSVLGSPPHRLFVITSTVIACAVLLVVGPLSPGG